jgi:TrmH RNA methyltransferase
MRPRPSEPRPPQADASEALYGLRAGLAVFARRPEDILRIAYSPAVRHEVAELVRWAAARRLPCHEQPEGEIARLAGSSHHEGLCLLVRPRRWATPAEFADTLLRTGGAAVAFDRVRNPYNIGAVLRSAAFFGLEGALLGAPAPHPALAPDAVRVAEGGTEHLLLSRTTDLAETLGRLRARGIQVVGAESDARANAIGFPFARPTLLVLGHEREGLSERVRAQCDTLVAIRGSGAIESLNVAIAASVLVAELVRGAAPRPQAPRPQTPAPAPPAPRRPPPRRR